VAPGRIEAGAGSAYSRVEAAVLAAYQKACPVGLLTGVLPPTAAGSGQWTFFHGSPRAGAAIPLTAKTILQVGSVTKTFTATLLAQACHEGLLRLEDAVQDYSPSGIELPVFTTWNQATPFRFLDLATHTAGLPLDPRRVPPFGYDVIDMYRYLDGYALAVAPGTSWNYSNVGFGLLGNVLVETSGAASFQALVEELQRRGGLAMPDTSITLGPEQRERRAWGYVQQEPPLRARWRTPTWPACDPSGALYSTLDDMLVWLSYNLGRLSSPLDGLLPVLQRVYFAGQGVAMGLAWQWGPLGAGSACWSKGGNTTGFTSFLAFSRELDAAVAILSNSIWFWGQDLAGEILAILAA
jgi:serine-type D-Ala-D-Ala carboxypeptidase/endopeptidase